MIGFNTPTAVLSGLGRRIAGGVLNQWFRPNGGRVFGDVPARMIYGATLALAAVVSGARLPDALRLWWPVGLTHWAPVTLHIPPAASVPTLAAAIIVLTAAGCSVPMWAIDPWRQTAPPEAPRWLRCIGLTAHGFLSILPLTAGAWLIGYGWYWLLLASLSIVPLYCVGFVIWGAGRDMKMPLGLRLPSELGEALWGMAVGLSILLAVGR